MSARGLAERYANAFVAAAGTADRAAAAVAELAAVADLVGRIPALAGCLASAAVPRADKQRVLDAVTRALSPLTRRFLAVLVEARRLPLLGEAAGAARSACRRLEGRLAVRVATALPLTEAEHAALRDRLARWARRPVDLSVDLEPGLQAGMTLRVGDRLYDGSLRGRLDRVRDALRE